MRIIEPSFEILHIMDFPLSLIEVAGRTCYKSKPKGNVESPQEFVYNILKRGHESVIEHASASVKIICDRGVTHEIVRHRLASYSQESTRYCNYSKDKYGGHLTFIKPCFFPDIPLGEYETAKACILETNDTLDISQAQWLFAMEQAEKWYLLLIDNGCKPQEARSVLPNSLKTEIVMTCNVREWRHFFKLRTSKAAHPQMREIAIPMLAEFKRLIPVIFDDIEVT